MNRLSTLRSGCLLAVILALFTFRELEAQNPLNPTVVTSRPIADLAIAAPGVEDISSAILPNIGQSQHKLTVIATIDASGDPCPGLGLITLQASFDGSEWFSAPGTQGLIVTPTSTGIGYIEVSASYAAIRVYIDKWVNIVGPCTMNIYYTGTVNPVETSKVNPPGWDFGMLSAVRTLSFPGAETQVAIERAENSLFDLPDTYGICLYGGYISTDAAVTITLAGATVSSTIYMTANSTFNFGQSVYPIICRLPGQDFTIETDGAADLGMILQYRYELR